MFGAILGGVASAYGQYRANKATRNYATKMSGTAHQRQMADLKAAGINPILAGRLGGASTPSYQAGNIGSAAVQGYGQVSSAKQAQAQTGFTKQQTINAVQQNKNLKAAYDVAKQQVKNMEEKWFIDRLTGTIMNRDNNFYQAVSDKMGIDIGPQGVTSAKQAADIVLKGIAQGGELAKFILNWKFKKPRGK